MKRTAFNRRSLNRILRSLTHASTSVMPCGAKVSTSNVSVTKGQQLMDLQKAYEGGIITEKEYNKQKEAILKASY